MSEDQNRDRDRGRSADDPAALYSENAERASGRPAEDRDDDREGDDRAKGVGSSDCTSRQQPEEQGDQETGVDAEPDENGLDEETVAKHREAKMTRARKRQAAARRRQEEAEGLPPGKAPVPAPGQGKGGRRRSALPALRPDIKPDTPALRAERVEAIRRDLVRRRRRKGGGMLLKLSAFVVLPTLLVAWFLWFEASNLYKSDASFMVQNAEAGGGAASGGFLGALLGGGGGGIYDPVAVQTYILSRDVLHRLDDQHGWIAHFQAPDLDFFHGLDPDASFETAFSHYQDLVSVSFDPTEGLLEMSVVAADPEAARRFSEAIIGYAEEMVDQLSERIRTDAMADAERNLAAAEERLKAAQQAEADLRKSLDTFSVEGEVSAEMSIIAGMETELERLKARLTNLRRVTSETDPRVERIRNQVETLTNQIAARRENVTGESRGAGASLADINADLARAQFDVQAAMAIFTAALEAREVARANAARQHRYLSVVAQPSLPDEANYPRKLEMVALAFLGFLGFYIIASLTISLIREQASI